MINPIIKEFREKFVYEDTGPDGDGYDALPDKWQEWFKGYEEPEQIRVMQSFTVDKLEEQKKEFETMLEKITIPVFLINQPVNAVVDHYHKNIDAIIEKLKETK